MNQRTWTTFFITLIALLAIPAQAAQPIWLSNLLQQATGTTVTGKNGLDVNVISPITASALNVSPTASAVPSNAAYIGGNKSGNLTGLLIGQQTMANSLACTLPSDQSAIPVTGTFWQATQPVSGSVSVSNFPGTQTVSGTVTANQGTANTAANGWPMKITNGTNTADVDGSNNLKVNLTTSIPGGANTIGNVNVNTLPSIPAGSNAIGSVTVTSAKAPLNATASGSSSTISTTAATLTAPANTVGFILQNTGTSTANIRYLVGGVTVTTSTGIQLAPGQDTNFIPAGSNISIIAESGTQSYAVQWVSQ